MCLAIPAKVIKVEGSKALVAIEDVEPGDFILLHAGFAIEKLDPEEAAETMRLLLEIEKNSPE